MEYPAVADYRVVRALVDACEQLKIPYYLGIVRTHDAYYMESPQAIGDYKSRIQPWIDMGVLALENESSSIFVISSMHGIRAGTILTSGNPIYFPNADDCDWDSNILKMVQAAILAAQLLHQRGLA